MPELSMKKIDWIVSVFAGIVLGMLGLTTGITNDFLHPKSASAERPIDVALSTILTSHARWHTVQGEAQFVWYTDDGSTQTYINKFALSQPDNVYGEVIDQTGLGGDGIWISDGKNIYDLNKQSKTYVQSIFRAALKDTSYLPSKLSDVNPKTVKFYPLATVINAPIREYLFPSWFPQGRDGDTYTLDKEETFLDKKVWVMRWNTIDNDETIVWVDKTTGIILKASQSMGGKPFLDMTFTSFDVNGKIDPDIFKVPQDYSPVSR
jgi:outer membrane lipoprotein-sorting protein